MLNAKTEVEPADLALGEKAYQKLKESIMNLSRKPGGTLTEIELIGSLQMSRTPIRQALHRLEQEGFVSLLPRKGWFINEISLRDIHEIFVVREALEGMAARLAAENISTSALQDLNLYMEKTACGNDSEGAFYDPGDEMHSKILSVANNQRLRTVLSLYDSHLQRFHQLALRLPGRSRQSHQEHVEIVQAINQHAGDEAEAAMRKHIQSSRKSLFDCISEGNGGW